MLRSYTRAINKRFQRTGNLFQQNTKSKEIADEKYLLTLVNYIHQNPVRAGIVGQLREWKFSSYCQIAESFSENIDRIIRIEKEFYNQYFSAGSEFERYSEAIVDNVRKEYWV